MQRSSYAACWVASPHKVLAESIHALRRDAVAAARVLRGAERGWAVIRLHPDSAPYAGDGRRSVAAASDPAARDAGQWFCDGVNGRLP